MFVIAYLAVWGFWNLQQTRALVILKIQSFKHPHFYLCLMRFTNWYLNNAPAHKALYFMVKAFFFYVFQITVLPTCSGSMIAYITDFQKICLLYFHTVMAHITYSLTN